MKCKLQVLSSVLLHKTIYISGIAAKDAPNSSQVQLFFLDSKKWSTLPKAPTFNAPMAAINGQITLIGGRDAKTNNISNILSTWFEKEHKWEELIPRMPTRRLESGVIYHDNLLLVVGGVQDSIVDETVSSIVVSTVHVYSFKKRQWSTPKALNIPIALRSTHLVVYKEHLYLFAGAVDHPAHNTQERLFNRHAWRAKWTKVKEAIEQDVSITETGQSPEQVKSVWEKIADHPLLRPTVISCQTSLITIGGLIDGSPQNTIYEFVDGNESKVENNSWATLGKINLGRYRHAAVPISAVPIGKHGVVLFVAGGYVMGNPMEDETHEKSASVEIVMLL